MGILVAWVVALAVAAVMVFASRRAHDDGSGRLLWRLGAVLLLVAVSAGTVIATSTVSLTFAGIRYDCGGGLSASHLTQNSDTTPLDADGLACKRAGRDRVELGRDVGVSLGGLALLVAAAGLMMARISQNRVERRPGDAVIS